MKVVAVTPNLKTVLDNLFDFYTSSNLNSHSPHESFVREAKKSIVGLSSDQKEEIVSFSTSGGDLFSMEQLQGVNGDKYDIILGFRNFLSAVKNVLLQYESQTSQYDGLQRKAAPPLKAYSYVGHNELDIAQSEIGYSLLFDKF